GLLLLLDLGDGVDAAGLGGAELDAVARMQRLQRTRRLDFELLSNRTAAAGPNSAVLRLLNGDRVGGAVYLCDRPLLGQSGRTDKGEGCGSSDDAPGNSHGDLRISRKSETTRAGGFGSPQCGLSGCQPRSASITKKPTT